MSKTANPVHFAQARRVLYGTLATVIVLHAGLLLTLRQPAELSRIFTASVPFLAAICALCRMRLLPFRERSGWGWLSVALLLWSAGQMVEIMVSRSPAASNLTADSSDFFYLASSFPLLLAIASTAENETVGRLFALNLAQALLGAGLSYLLLFKTLLPAQDTKMQTIYAMECGLLAIAAAVRLITWSTSEERRRVRMMCLVLWMYLPIELGMDYATRHWALRSGTLLDLLWSVPFLLGGWLALRMPFDELQASLPRHVLRRKGTLLLESLCPLLITVGVFLLAASVMVKYPAIAIAAMLLLLILQALHSGLIQMNYQLGQRRLLAAEANLKQANAGLEKLSWLDPLTGVSNRRHFTTVLETEWRRATRRQQSIGILMIDVDHFKGVNDLHGHSYGDECLIKIANALRQELRRSGDLVARFGGEEFILFLPETDLTGALAVAERMHRAIGMAGIVNQASQFNQLLTVSVGAAAVEPWPSLQPSLLIEAADAALYDAKRHGRNQVCFRKIQPGFLPMQDREMAAPESTRA